VRGERILELGCGWGGFARYAAEHYGVEVVAYNISAAQVEWARARCKGLPVEFHLQDYREATGAFDKVAAIGLCEHVGYKNYRSFFKLVHGCLKPGGIFLLHTIGRNRSAHCADPWIDRYIFPGGMLPSPSVFTRHAQAAGLALEERFAFGTDYARTLREWHQRFSAALPQVLAQGFDIRFVRTWSFYLAYCEAGFAEGSTDVVQYALRAPS